VSKKLKIVSACLAGVECRYDCQAQSRQDIIDMVNKGEAIPVCPEQLGGLPTPRPPAEIVGEKVLTKDGDDVTENYRLGAEEALKIVKENGCDEVYLKSKSPMCGYGKIYDGSHSGKLIEGHGTFARLLKKIGIKINSID
jgi:uncharacterized protein YbbK (DUF523 family)